MQEGLLAMGRGRWERAEQRLLAARAQLGQVAPVSWRAFRAGHLLLQLRLAQGELAAAAQVAREQLDLAQRLYQGDSLELGWVLCDLAFVLGALAAGEGAAGGTPELDQVLERLQALAMRALCQRPLLGVVFLQQLVDRLHRLGRREQAARVCKQALRAAGTAPAPDRDTLIQAISRLVSCHLLEASPGQAGARALALAQEQLGRTMVPPKT